MELSGPGESCGGRIDAAEGEGEEGEGSDGDEGDGEESRFDDGGVVSRPFRLRFRGEGEAGGGMDVEGAQVREGVRGGEEE